MATHEPCHPISTRYFSTVPYIWQISTKTCSIFVGKDPNSFISQSMEHFGACQNVFLKMGFIFSYENLRKKEGVLLSHSAYHQ